MGSLDFEVGDSVRVKEGVTDPDSTADITGWQGRISEVGEGPDGEPFVVVAWDSHTLRGMPEWYLEQSETESLDWKHFVLKSEDVQHARSRDTQREVDEATEEIESRLLLGFFRSRRGAHTRGPPRRRG